MVVHHGVTSGCVGQQRESTAVKLAMPHPCGIITWVGHYDIVPDYAGTEKKFISSWRFDIPNRARRFFTNAGKMVLPRFFIAENLPEEHKTRRCYRSLHFHHNCREKGLSSINVADAFNFRLNNKRDCDNVGFHEQLIDNQNFHYLNSSVLWFFLETIHDRVVTGLLDTDDDDTEQLKYVTKEHPKRQLRIAAYLEAIEFCLRFALDYFKPVSFKIKQFEWMKVAQGVPKACRGLMDMLPARSIVGGWLVDIAKTAMSIPIVYPLSSPSIFLKFVGHVSFEELDSVFWNLFWNPAPIVYYWHSDDSVLRLKYKNGSLYMNLDISSCDGSHYKSIFSALSYLLTTERTALLVKQMLNGLIAPLKFKGERSKFTIYPKEHVLYTGSILTTITNNVGVLFIISAIYERYGEILNCESEDEVIALIKACANTAGYIVTVGSCTSNFHSCQFLKHSPNSDCQAYINLSVILRCLGYKRDRYPKENNFEYLHCQRELIRCFVHYTDDRILDALRRRYQLQLGERPSTDSGIYLLDLLNGNSTTGHSRKYTTDDYCRRYGVTPCAIDELCECIESAPEDSMISTILTSRAFQLDYEYECEAGA
jgi:hypothetical protein